VLSHELHLLVLGMVLEVGAQPIAPCRPDHVRSQETW
jgi:hypothetical protein